MSRPLHTFPVKSLRVKLINIGCFLGLVLSFLMPQAGMTFAARREGDPILPPTLVNKAYLPIVNMPATINRGIAELPASLSLPKGFVSEVIATGLDLPTAITFAADNRIFIAEKNGLVRVWQNNLLQPQPFIDLSAEVNSARDRGLLGIAAHPQFPVQPYIYVLFSYDPPGVKIDGVGARVIRLLRLTADADQNYNVALSDPAASTLLLGKNSTRANIGNENDGDDTERVACQTGPAARATSYTIDCVPADSAVHSSGALRFGPDGMLYVSIGDNATPWAIDPRALRAQSLDNLAGKVLRIDPMTGAGLRDNPFFDGNVYSNRSKVFNYGLRNPFRFTFKPNSALTPITEVIIGDVGWNTSEEVNIGRGKNFGWPCYEGDSKESVKEASYANNPRTSAQCNELYRKNSNDLQKPAFAYDTLPEGGAVMVGDVYAGTVYPADYRSAVFFADYERQWIKYAQIGTNGSLIVKDFARNAGAVVDMATGPNQDLYYVVIGQKPEGEVRRIRYIGGNITPNATATANVTSGPIPLTVQFSSVGSVHPAGLTLNYAWDFGDGSTSTEANPLKIYTTAGQFKVRLIVSDAAGQKAEASVVIMAGSQRPTLQIQSPRSGSTYWVGDTINLAATAQDAEDGDIGANIHWQVIQHHNDHAHYDAYPISDGPVGGFVVANHGSNTYLQICATVIDSSGVQSEQICVTLRPETTQYTFDSEPSGMQILFEGASRITPFSVDVIINSQIEIGVPESQKGLNFVGWSDGGSRTRVILIENEQRRYIARYNAPPAPQPASLPADPPISPISSNICSNNLLSNGGFENGLAVWNTSGPIAKIVSDSHNGKNALYLDQIGGSAGQNMPAQANVLYHLRGWGKIAEDTVAQVGMNFYDIKWNRVGQTIADVSTLDYNEFSIQAIAPQNTAVIEIWAYKNAGGGLWLDDMCLIR